ncbi:MAG: hypothetical protein P8Y97_12275 [Candidatus Lokiarchaeota archaeon]
MYLFKEKDQVSINYMCKACLENITFKISQKEYNNVKDFPFEKISIHGIPEHKLKVLIDKNLEIENFEIEKLDEEKEISSSEQLTKQVLSDLGLSDEEIELYFLTARRDAVSLGEMALLIDKSKEECDEIAKKFINKGLYKEIVGATPHFAPLPPYAALVYQLETFHDYIDNIQANAPVKLEKSFNQLESQSLGVKDLKDYVGFIQNLKENTLKQIKNQQDNINNIFRGIERIKEVSREINEFDTTTRMILNNQIKNFKNEFNDLNEKMSDGIENQIKNFKSNFNNMNDEISEAIESQINNLSVQFEIIKERVKNNLQKLHLGIVQKTVEKVIQNVFKGWISEIKESLTSELQQINDISRNSLENTTKNLKNQLVEIDQITTNGLRRTTQDFNENFVTQLEKSIEKTTKNVNGITNSTEKSGEEFKEVFLNLSKDFNTAVVMAEERIKDISDNIFRSFKDLRGTFSDEVLNTLEDVLKNILSRLKQSKTTTIEFWDQARATSIFSMQDIWFIRSIESAKAHLNNQISKTKMRLLIITPEISDIDPQKIVEAPKHINIRIVSFIDPNNPKHVRVLRILDDLPNVTYRHRDLQNLWGVSRDYEEVILCVVSKTEVYGKITIEIGGIGSIIEEHIKIFTPILEEAWVGAQKNVFIPKKTQDEEKQILEDLEPKKVS